MTTTPVRIGPHTLSSQHEPYIVAELSGNHNGQLERALEIVDAIADAGAHAVKLQTYTPDTITLNSRRDEFFVDGDHALWGAKNLYELYEQAHTPWEWHAPLFERAHERGLTIFSSPFDATAVEFLEKLECPAYKIASAEIVDLPLIRRAAETGKPVIISTGMASLGEIAAAVETARDAGCEQLIVLGCTAAYPADPAECNVRKLNTLSAALDCPIGYSDHTLGIGVSLAAIAQGAVLIEKHVTDEREKGGVDSAFSLDTAELRSLVTESKRAWQALGTPTIGTTSSEETVRRLRRSLYVTRDVTAGEKVTSENLRSVRPADGLPPVAADHLYGMVFARDVSFAEPAAWEMFSPR